MQEGKSIFRNSPEASEAASGDSSTSPSAESDSTSESNNILIAYFSHTGNTEEAAQKIAEYTGGDLTEIQRAEEYENLNEEAEAEILDGVHPDITVSVENIADYDTVFVGYPIWWDEAPTMIATFLADNDFSGKMIIPFCTSSSDDIDNSLHIFSELCPDAAAFFCRFLDEIISKQPGHMEKVNNKYYTYGASNLSGNKKYQRQKC